METKILVATVLLAWAELGCDNGGASDEDGMPFDVVADADEGDPEADAVDETADGGDEAAEDGPEEAAPDLAGDGGAGRVGDPCTESADCPAGGSGSAVCLTDWPGGYCAVEACADHGHDCPEDPGLGGTATTGGKCVLDPTQFCLALCASDGDCRPGYVCSPQPDAAGHGTANVCVPSAPGGDAGMDGSGDAMGGDGMMGEGGM
ncbi:MAG: hypothetical protein HY907_21240 [Deltaproteobacteria bacterium]|nr:hypothetical protein [Deltaproteobacteria bacterium]